MYPFQGAGSCDIFLQHVTHKIHHAHLLVKISHWLMHGDLEMPVGFLKLLALPIICLTITCDSHLDSILPNSSEMSSLNAHLSIHSIPLYCGDNSVQCDRWLMSYCSEIGPLNAHLSCKMIPLNALLSICMIPVMLAAVNTTINSK